VLEHLATPAVLELSEEERLPLWQALSDLAGKHRAFSNAEWALPLDDVERLEAAAARITPTSPNIVYRRLFNPHFDDALVRATDYEEALRDLTRQRQAAVSALFEKGD